MEMKTIAILSQKGGAGKSTFAVHLAVAGEDAGHLTAVLDLDPQATATQWGDSRAKDGPTVMMAHAPRLPAILQTAASNGVTLAILDTPAGAQSDALTAAEVADVILIPCRPGIFDLRAIGKTVQIARLANKPAAIVLNSVTPNAPKLLREAVEAARTHGIEVAPVHLCHRSAFRHSAVTGQTAQEYETKGGGATEEVRQLYEWVCQFGGITPYLNENKK